MTMMMTIMTVMIMTSVTVFTETLNMVRSGKTSIMAGIIGTTSTTTEIQTGRHFQNMTDMIGVSCTISSEKRVMI